MRKYFIWGVIITLGAIGGFMFFDFVYPETNIGDLSQESSSNNRNTSSGIGSSFGSSKDPTPTPQPFAELTIPHLRNRTYSSTLTQGNQVSRNNNYTSYLSSYDSDGLNINGLLTIPNAEQPSEGWPAIVFVHGYIPPSLYNTTENYNSYVDYFADRGFVVFKIDLRGHADSEGIPGGAYFSSDYIIDTLNAHDALQSTEFVNADAVGLWGHSMAGNVVFRSLVSQYEEIPAAVIWAGAVYTYEDFQEYRLNDSSYRPPDEDSERRQRRSRLYDTHGEFSPDSAFWQQVVPVNYLAGVNSALQIHHAVNDPVVRIDYSRNFINVANSVPDLDLEYELYEYQSGGHNITGSAFNTAMERSTNFFREKLQ